MIDPKASADEKLSMARQLYQEATDHYDECNEERHRASRFYHNTSGEGQWESDDLEYLRKAKRPAFTFNVLKSKVDTAIGMHKDMQRTAVVRPVGSEDKFLAEVVDAISHRIKSATKATSIDDAVRRTGYVKGEGIAHFDVTQDPMNPTEVMMEMCLVSPHEVDWDPGSVQADRSDARYVCWSRWFTKGEFRKEYPEHKNEWSNLSKGGAAEEEGMGVDQLASGEEPNKRDYNTRTHYYWDRHRKRAKVIHLEYKHWRKQKFALLNGIPMQISDKEYKLLQKYDELVGDIQVVETDIEDTHVLEFVSSKVLHDSTQHEGPHYPFDGFSLVSFCFAMDEEEGIPHGMVRNLMDPQMELNKAWSLELEHVRGQGRPGYIAEEDAVPDLRAFEDAVHTSGAVATVSKGALSGQMIRERTVPQPSSAGQQRLENSFRAMDIISGISLDMQQPAAQQEAATTVAIRYHKSQLGLADVRANFDAYQREGERRRVQTIIRAMPDSQLQALLGNDEKYVVQQGTIIELGPHPTEPGQKIPKNQAQLQKLRTLRYDIELTNTTENTTLAMIELQALLQLMQVGAPVDPLLLVERAATSRADRERLREFAEQSAQSQAQMAQQQAEQANRQVEAAIQIEAQNVEEKSRHNRVEETLKAEKQYTESQNALLAILEKSDEKETKAFLELARVIADRQSQREQTQAKMTPQGGMIH